MGCGVSRIDGAGMVLPPRLRPLFLLRLEEIKLRRHTTSKKQLLLDDRDIIEDENGSSKSYKNDSKSTAKGPGNDRKEKASDKNEHKDDGMKDGGSRGRAKNDQKDNIKIEGHASKDADNDDDDDDDDERMIGRGDNTVFPGSPSFRVYFKDDGRNDQHKDTGKNDASKNTVSSDNTVSSKDSSSDNKKKAKRGRKKKNLRKALPKGGQTAVKNLLSVKSCYSSSPSAHLLTGKTTA